MPEARGLVVVHERGEGILSKSTEASWVTCLSSMVQRGKDNASALLCLKTSIGWNGGGEASIEGAASRSMSSWATWQSQSSVNGAKDLAELAALEQSASCTKAKTSTHWLAG